MRAATATACHCGTCEKCRRAQNRANGLTSKTIDMMLDRGLTIAHIAERVGRPRSTISGWRVLKTPPPELSAVWREYSHYPPAADMFADLKTRGWKPAELARRLNTTLGAVHQWLHGHARCAQPHVMPALHQLWLSGEIMPRPIHRAHTRNRRTSPPPETWDPDNLRKCLANPQAWDGETEAERSHAIAQCRTCPVLRACEKALEKDLEDGIGVSGVIAAQWVPWRYQGPTT